MPGPIQDEERTGDAPGQALCYRTLFDHADDALFVQDASGRFLDANAAACGVLGRSRDELIGLTFHDVTRAQGRADEPSSVPERMPSLEDGDRLSFDALFVRPDGKTVPAEVVCARVGSTPVGRPPVGRPPVDGTPENGEGQVLFLSSARKFSRHRRREEALAHANADWEQTFHAITDPLVLTDAEGRVIRANRTMLERLRLTQEEIRGRSAPELLCPDGSQRGCAAEGMTDPRSWEADLPKLGGQFQVTTFPYLGEDGALSTILFYCSDVTQERQLRARMLQTEKLSSLGQLVSGVAHELNNPLAAVQGLAELLLEDLQETGQGDVEDVRNILEQSQRASGIVRNLLQFSRRSHHKGELYDCNAAVRAAVSLLRYRLSSREIQLDLDLAADLPPLFGVLQQVEQVLVNLVLNAYEALSDSRKGGRIRVATGVDPDGMVQIVVEDDGPGVPSDHATRLFEPFFTTKEVGRGTGLGLSVSYGLVQEQGGDIQLDTAYTAGARFVVRLPAADKTRNESMPAILDDEDPPHGVVLLIDDEPEWAEAMREALASRGFHATGFTSTAEALVWLAERPADLVICDADLAGDDGTPFHDEVIARFPALRGRVGLVVGAGSEVPGGLEAAWPVLRKPFSTDRLYDWAVRQSRIGRDGA